MIKVIQVGIGGMGNTWLNTVLQSSEVEYAALVEVDGDIAQRQIEKYGLEGTPLFDSLAEALAAVSADGVIDVTPPVFHRDISTIALEAGLPVLSEKPLANTLANATAIVRKASESAGLHMVAQNYRYHGPVQTLKRVLDSGRLGRVGAVTVEFFKGPHFGGFREEMAYPLIIDMAIHHFDLLRFFLGCEPVSVFGRSWNPPWSWYKGDASSSVSFEFANGIVATYNGSWCATGQETPWNGHWRFDCERGVVWLHDDQVYTQFRSDTLQDQGGYRQFQDEGLARVEPVVLDRVAQAYLLHEFYLAVTQGLPPVTTCQDNIKSLAMVFASVESFETRAPVRIGS